MSDPPTPAGSLHRRTLAAVIAVASSGVLPVSLVGAMAVQMSADIGLTTADIGVATSVFFASCALCSAPAGRAVQYRLGARRGMQFAALTSACAATLIFVFVQGPLLLWSLMALAGIANAVAQPASNLLVAAAIPPERLGLAFAVKQSAIPAGVLMAGLAVPLVAVHVGWRWAYAGAAALAFAALPIIPKDVVTTAMRRTPHTDEHRDDSRVGDDETRRDSTSARERLQGSRLMILAVGAAFAAVAAASLSTFLVSSAVNDGLGDSAAGWLLAGGSVLMIVVRLGLGSLADRRWDRPLLVIVALLIGGSFGFALLGVATLPTLYAGCLLAFGLGWAWPGLFNYSVVRYFPTAAGHATGITQTGIYLGAVIGPLAFGLLAETAGFTPGWLVACGCSLAGAAALALGNRLIQAGRWSAILRAGTPAQNS